MLRAMAVVFMTTAASACRASTGENGWATTETACTTGGETCLTDRACLAAMSWSASATNVSFSGPATSMIWPRR